MLRVPFVLLFSCSLLVPAPAQDGAPRRFDAGGDLDKIEWIRPFAKAHRLARDSQRVMLVKPILGGGNAPAPSGVPCGGKNDCEGSW